MSSIMRWAILQSGNCVDDRTKHILKRRYEDVSKDRVRLTLEDLDYLKGVRDAAKDKVVKEDVEMIIKRIEAGDVIEIWEEF